MVESVHRSKYVSTYAPPAQDLIDRWTSELPSGSEVESFFLNELCESSEHEYFLCLSDLFLSVTSRQAEHDQRSSLKILYSRLLDAAEFARGLHDKMLVDHFSESIRGFSKLYDDVAEAQEFPSDGEAKLIGVGSLVLRTIKMKDLPMARLIARRERELVCTNPECDNESEIQCPDCDAYINPYEFHARFHNMRNDARIRVLRAQRSAIVPTDNADIQYGRIDSRIQAISNTPASLVIAEFGGQIKEASKF